VGGGGGQRTEVQVARNPAVLSLRTRGI